MAAAGFYRGVFRAIRGIRLAYFLSDPVLMETRFESGTSPSAGCGIYFPGHRYGSDPFFLASNAAFRCAFLFSACAETYGSGCIVSLGARGVLLRNRNRRLFAVKETRKYLSGRCFPYGDLEDIRRSALGFGYFGRSSHRNCFRRIHVLVVQMGSWAFVTP